MRPGCRIICTGLFYLLASWLLRSTVQAQAFDTLVLHTPEDAARFDSRYIQLQKLPAGSVETVRLIRTEAFEKRFVPYHPDSITCRRCVYWGKFYLKNALSISGLWQAWVLEFNDASYIDVYIFDRAGRQLFHGKTGKLVPARVRTVPSNFKTNRVRFSLEDTAAVAVYFRYERTRGYAPAFDALRLVPAGKVRFPGSRQDIFFMGFLLTALLFNLLFFFGTRNRAFLYQTLFILSVGVFMCETAGFTQDAPFFRDHPFYIMPVSYIAVTVLTLAYIQFVRVYVGLRTLLPHWDRIAQMLCIASLVALVAVLSFYFISGNEYACDRAFIGFLIVEYLILAWLVFSLRQHKERATYFLTGAMALVIAGILVNVASIYQGKSIQPGFIKLVLAGNIALFFLGLAYRMRKLVQEEQEAGHQRAINELKNRLFANITHEFRTPLTVIEGMAEQIDRAPKVQGETAIQKAVALIRFNSKRLLQLVNRMLDLAKLESGQMELSPHRGDIIAQIRFLVEAFEPFAATKNIHLQLLTDLPAFEIDYDHDKFQEIISNLISNAVKFTPDGGRIFVSVKHIGKQENGELLLECRDTGVGILPDELDHVFERFYQAKTVKKKEEGTGIGLSLTRELVRLMGGTIAVESMLGSGTCFTVRIPVVREASTPKSANTGFELPAELLAPETDLANKPMNPLSGQQDTAKPLILLIDDQTDIIYYLRTILEVHYELETANNGSTGIDLAFDTIPDIIISDVMMPEKDGFEVCETLKNDPRTSHIPIVLLTAKADFEDRIAGLKRGADAYLTKPFREEELLARLENLLQGRKRLQERYSQPVSLTDSDDPDLQVEDAFVSKLRQEVEKYMPDEHFGIAQLCRAMKMSRTQLHRKITALTGKSTSHYIRSARLYRAKELLHDSSRTIAEIAYAVGFSDPNYFTRTFTAEFGATPGSFRH